jgi:hypothetical protein
LYSGCCHGLEIEGFWASIFLEAEGNEPECNYPVTLFLASLTGVVPGDIAGSVESGHSLGDDVRAYLFTELKGIAAGCALGESNRKGWG